MSNYREERPDFVNALQGLISKAQREHTHDARLFDDASPASIIHYELKREVSRHRYQQPDKQKADFFETLSDAWDALAVEQYTANITKEDAYDTVYFRHKHALERNDHNADVIPLSPQQTAIIDILADAANIPHRHKGRQYVPIPPKGRRSNYWSK